MATRPRLIALVSKGAELATTKRARVVAQILLLLGLVFAFASLRSIWHRGQLHRLALDAPALVAACALTLVGVLACGFIWLAILRTLGLPTRPSWAGIYFQAQLGKYIPGSLWQYASRAAIARSYGLPLRPVGISLPIEITGSAIAAGAVGLFLLGSWGLAGLGVLVLVGLLLAAGLPLRFQFAKRWAVRALATTFVLYVGVWMIVGTAFWFTARSLSHVSTSDVPFYAGAFATAWLVGLVAVYAPGGLGVREAVLIVLLRHRLGSADALVVAVVYRAILTVCELFLAGLSVGSRRLARTGETTTPLSPAPPGDATRP